MKKTVVFILCAVICALLILFSSSAAQGAREGFELWAKVLLPALLPFFVCTKIMQACGLGSGPAMLFAMSFLSGAPSGARLCSGDSSRDVTPIAAALNTVSPAFICCAYAPTMLRWPDAACPIMIAQFIAALVFFIWALRKNSSPITIRENTKRLDLSLFASAVTESMLSLVSICGMVIIFSVFGALLRSTKVLGIITWPVTFIAELFGGKGKQVEAFVSALLEIASGSVQLAKSGLGSRALIALSAFAFSFGGLCIGAQSMLFVPIKPGRYILLKAMQGALAAIIAFIICPLFPEPVRHVSAPLDQMLENTAAAGAVFISVIYALSITMLICLAVRRHKQERLRKAAFTSAK